MSRLKELIHEIHRRSLWQVLAIYVGVSWVVLQVVEVLSETAGLPSWVGPGAIVLLLLGLPIVMATAFVQEGVGPRATAASTEATSPEDARRTEGSGGPGKANGRIRDRLFTWRNAILGGVAAFALLGVVTASWVLLGGPFMIGAGDGDEAKSIAVLPLENMSEDPANEHFADGITDDIITQLSKLSDLKVISRTSTMRYKDTDKSLREIGEELGVATVLEGGVRREGDEVRINAQLIDARTDQHLWAETYDRRLTDIFAIQSDVALRIAEALRARLSESERERIESRPTDSSEAYELYQRGRSLWYRRSQLDSAIHYYERALDIDPDFALAYTAGGDPPRLSQLRVRVASGILRPGRTLRPKGYRHRQPSGRAPSSSGLVPSLYIYHHEWEAADREFRRTLELSPSYATGHYWYSYYLFRRGRVEEGIQRGRQAVELDPRSPAIVAGLGGRLYWARRYREAEEWLSRALRLEAGYFGALTWLGLVRVAQGRADEGISLLERVASRGTPTTRVILAYAYAAGDRPEDARFVLEELQAQDAIGYVSPTWIAATHAALGDTDATFQWLETAYEERDDWLTNIGVGPWMDPLREHRRFSQMLMKIGLSPAGNLD